MSEIDQPESILKDLKDAKSSPDPASKIKELLLRAQNIYWITGAKILAKELKKAGGIPILEEIARRDIMRGFTMCTEQMLLAIPFPKRQELGRMLVKKFKSHGEHEKAARAQKRLKTY